jgi:hypothetical protein
MHHVAQVAIGQRRHGVYTLARQPVLTQQAVDQIGVSWGEELGGVSHLCNPGIVVCSPVGQGVQLAADLHVGIENRHAPVQAEYPLIDRAAKSPEEWEQLFEDLQVLEGAALKQMSDNRSDT